MKTDNKKKWELLSNEDVNVSIRWVKDEILVSETMKLFNRKTWGANIYAVLARGLRQAYREGRLKIVSES